MGYRTDLTGKRYGRWTVIEFSEEQNKWLCRCDCGTEKYFSAGYLNSGVSHSCGCLQRELSRGQKHTTIHGDSHSALYRTWKGMKARCYNPHNPSYKRYGGRGITVCEEWHEWLPFKEWALSHGYSPELSIDRINNDGNYEPDNCRWATVQQQADNKSTCKYMTYDGMTMTLGNWARYYGIVPETFRWYVRKVGFEKAIEYYKRKVAENG